MQVLLGLEAGDVEIAIALVHHLHVDEAPSSHHSFHETEVKAPDHDDTKDYAEWEHDNPIFDIVDVEYFDFFEIIIV